MSNRFSNELEQSLKKAGWLPGRHTSHELAQLCFPMHAPGTAFLAEFGGLAIGGTLMCDAHYANKAFHHRDRLAPAALPDCLPVALSWYWCEGTLWLDGTGRAYQSDDHVLALVGETIEEAMELLVLRKEIPPHFQRWDILPTPPNPYDYGVTP